MTSPATSIFVAGLSCSAQVSGGYASSIAGLSSRKREQNKNHRIVVEDIPKKATNIGPGGRNPVGNTSLSADCILEEHAT